MTITLDLTLAGISGEPCVTNITSLDAPVPLALDLQRLRALASDTRSYGNELSARLFSDTRLRQDFAVARALAAQRNQPLHLRLIIPPELTDLHALRWETLTDPDTPGLPLATNARVLLSRTLPAASHQPLQRRAPSSLRAVLLVAAPADLQDYNLAELNADQEIGQLRAQLSGCRVTVLGQQLPASLPALHQQLAAGCDLLVLLAHSRLIDDERGPKQTTLYLEDAARRTAPVAGQELLERIAWLDSKPRLVILGCCESAGDGAGSPLAALGPQLVRAGVPAVLAMQGRITLETLGRFLPACLQALLKDGQIDQAVAVARAQVYDRPDWWMPALWTSSTDGRLWEAPPPADTPAGVTPGPLSARQRDELLDRLAMIYNGRSPELQTQQVQLLLGLHTRPDAVEPSWRRPRTPAAASPIPPGTPLLELFEHQAGQLLVLGAPGAGKSTLLLKLAHDLTLRAQADRQARIPVLLNLAGWRSGQSLREWLAATLPDRLGASKRFAAQLAASDELVLLLDGLDEVDADHRQACVAAINAELRRHALAPPVVVGCRSREYGDLGTKLQLAGAVELEPLELAAVKQALTEIRGAQGVLEALQTDALLRELATTPLMINVLLLAHTSQAVPATPAQTLEQRRAALWRAYVRRMLEQRELLQRTPQQALCWLRWLACLLRAQGQTNFLIDDLQPTALPSGWLRWWYRGLVALLVALLAGLLFGPAYAWATDLVFESAPGWAVGLVFTLVYAAMVGLHSRSIERRERQCWSWTAFRLHLLRSLRSALSGGLIGMLYGLLLFEPTSGAILVLARGLMGALVSVLLGALTGTLRHRIAQGWESSDLLVRSAPMQGLHASMRTGLLYGPLYGLVYGLIYGLIFGLLGSPKFGLMSGLIIGLDLVLLSGLVGGLKGIIQHYALRLVLTQTRLFPFRTVTFLEAMSERLLLERDGAFYRFRHLLLRDYIAALSDAEVAELVQDL